MSDEKSGEIPTIQKVISILWPSFLTAGVATILVFAAFDPVEIVRASGYGEISSMSGYTMGFFFFWLVTSTSCALTCYFQKPCNSNN